jgi:transposase
LNAPFSFGISPLKGFGLFVVATDVADEFPSEIFNRDEDATSDDITLDFGKPDLNLVKPGGVGRGVMETNITISLQELPDLGGTMSREIVGDDMDFLCRGLARNDLFVAFLEHLLASLPQEQAVHIICDNLSAHKTQAVGDFLARHPNVRIHYTPTYSSWLNQIEIWFSKIQRDIIARGIFTSVADLDRKIMRYIRSYNQSATPIKWSYKDVSNRIKPTSEINDTLH